MPLLPEMVHQYGVFEWVRTVVGHQRPRGRSEVAQSFTWQSIRGR